jgi:hypothetical protein
MSARRDALAAAIARLREVLKAPESDVTRDAAIQRFELAWEVRSRAGARRGLGLPVSQGLLESRLQDLVDRKRAGLAGYVERPEQNFPHVRRSFG